MTSIPSPAPRPVLRRSRPGAMAGGVCTGLAAWSGVDAVLWRVAFIGLTLAGGAGVLVYLLLWVGLPPGEPVPGDRERPLDRMAERVHERLGGGVGSPRG